MGCEIRKTAEYIAWFTEQTRKLQAQIEKRLENIRAHGHFGHVRVLSERLAEIKFNNGVRIYFTRGPGNEVVILLLGGNKNGQSKDIKKAEGLLD